MAIYTLHLLVPWYSFSDSRDPKRGDSFEESQLLSDKPSSLNVRDGDTPGSARHLFTICLNVARSKRSFRADHSKRL